MFPLSHSLAGLNNEPASTFDPLSLFQNGETPRFYLPIPSYNGTQLLFQDAAGTTPVTADGQPVGLMKEIVSATNNVFQNSAGNKPIYRTDGSIHWLEMDGSKWLEDNNYSGSLRITTDTSGMWVVATSSNAVDDVSGVVSEEDVSDANKRTVIFADTRVAPSPLRIANYNPAGSNSQTVDLQSEWDGSKRVIGLTINASSLLTGYINGVAEDTLSGVTGDAFNSRNLMIGRQTTGSLYLNGNFYGCIGRGGTVSSLNEVQDASAFLATMAGI